MQRLRSRLAAAAFAAIVSLALAGCNQSAASEKPYDPQALPTGPVGDAIREGHDIIVDTQTKMKGYVTANITCGACHIDGGTKARGGSFVGVYGRFPQWNKRAHRVIALQDRLAECFLYSMNGHPPPYNSKAMIAMVAYIAYLSRDVPVGKAQAETDRFMEPLPSASPDVEHGKTLYTQKCSMCHGANGAGAGSAIPPLWGATSFNDGAGMAHIDRMTGFVHYNMPQNAPGTLSLQEAYDVSAWVLTHERPKFDKERAIQFPPDPANYF